MAYWQWGDAAASHVVVCVHGLSRQGRDFDVLAQALVARAGGQLRVVCPDVVGRGRSDWLKDPAGYQDPHYVGDMLAMLAQLNAQAKVEELDWVGTSMGGLIGMALAGTPDQPLQQAADAMWAISTGSGPHTPEQRTALPKPMVKELPDGTFTLHYDPSISVAVKATTEDAAAQGTAMLWQAYDNIKARVLVTRGAGSDLLAKETALAMTQRGPRASLVEFPGVGHAPTFVQPNQVEAVTLFLLD